jgi:hypothetical protein
LPSRKQTIVGSTLTASCIRTALLFRTARARAPLSVRVCWRRRRRRLVMRRVGMAKPRAQTSHRRYPCNAVLFHRDARNRGHFAFCTKKGAFSEFRYRNLTPRCRGAILRRCISARCRHIGTAKRHCIGAADMLALIDRSGKSRGRDRDTDQQLCRIRSRCGRNAPPRASTRLP